MQEIVNIKIEELGDFPKQEEIYGEAVVEAEFVASVKECGVITPLIVCQASDLSPALSKGEGVAETPYIIISGHRRRMAAIAAELEEVPATIRHYDSSDEAELEFLTCNMQREKTDAQRLKEFLAYKQTLCQISKMRKKSRSYENTVFENPTLARILADNVKIENMSDLSIDSYEILKKITGYTEYEQTCLTVLYDGDWLQKKLDKLRILKCPLALEEELIRLREQAVKVYEDGDCTLNNAVSEIKRIFKEAEDKLKPKEKPQPKEKPLNPQRGNKSKQLKLFVAIEDLGLDPQVEKSDFRWMYNGKVEGGGIYKVGTMHDLRMLPSYCIETPKGTYHVNPERLVEMLAKEIGI